MTIFSSGSKDVEHSVRRYINSLNCCLNFKKIIKKLLLKECLGDETEKYSYPDGTFKYAVKRTLFDAVYNIISFLL